MKTLAGVVAAAFLALATSMAVADEATGTVQSIDTEAMTLTLDDGTVYVLPENFDEGSVQAGDAVTITYSVENDENVATDVVPSN